MKNTRFIFITILLMIAMKPGFALDGKINIQKSEILNFTIDEDILNSSRLRITATDHSERPIKNINGSFQFRINGFKNELVFREGTSLIPQEITESTFIYLSHKNESGTKGKLFYVLKKGEMSIPIEINWIFLAIIPLSILILIFLFRKMIIIGGLIMILIFVFSSNKGLNLSTFLETLFDGLKSLVWFLDQLVRIE